MGGLESLAEVQSIKKRDRKVSVFLGCMSWRMHARLQNWCGENGGGRRGDDDDGWWRVEVTLMGLGGGE